MIQTMFQVALGGAIGSAARYLAGVAVMRGFGPHDFPLGVIAVNIVGSFLMGALVVFLAQKELTHWNAFLAVGVLGGFTTFSAFSLEMVLLIERGQYLFATLYAVLSFALGISGLMVGLALMRMTA